MDMSYEKILRDAESLSRVDQLRLISELAEYLRTHPADEPRTSIMELEGLGKKSGKEWMLNNMLTVNVNHGIVT